MAPEVHAHKSYVLSKGPDRNAAMGIVHEQKHRTMRNFMRLQAQRYKVETDRVKYQLSNSIIPSIQEHIFLVLGVHDG